MLLLLVGLLNATYYDFHKDIKILTEDKEYELRLTDNNIQKQRLMFFKTTPYNNRMNIFTYNPVVGGIKTMYNEFLTRNIDISGNEKYIEPRSTQNTVDDWKVVGVGSNNRIKNSVNMCFKVGKYDKDLNGYEVLGVPCTLSDIKQHLYVVEIPREDLDVCQLLLTNENACNHAYAETITDVKSRPNLV